MLKSLVDIFESWFKRIYNRDKCKFAYGATIKGNCSLEGGNFLDRNSQIKDCVIGFGSYLGRNTVLNNCKIGRYTCIGPNVHIICGEHPSKTFVSIHPAFYSLRKQSGFTYVTRQLFEENKYADNEGKYSVIIGNDVWIGDGAKILGGVSIGDGAIIAAGAIVTKNVDDYMIVGGFPAKSIRKRFDEEVINKLIEIKWWDKDSKWLSDNAEYFCDVQRFLSHVEGEIGRN